LGSLQGNDVLSFDASTNALIEKIQAIKYQAATAKDAATKKEKR
jgi:hypothetical protein